MWFITFILANLLGRPARTLLTLSGIAIAVAAVVSLLGVVHGFEKSLLDLYRGRGIDVMVQQAGRVQLAASVLPEAMQTEIAAVPGVEAVYPSLLEVLSLLDDDMMGVVVQGWPPESEPVRRLEFIAGGSFSIPAARQVIVGQRLAAALQVSVGDPVELIEGDEPFEVVGLFRSGNVFDSGSMFVPLEVLQELMFRSGEVTMFAVVTEQRELAAMRQVAEQISDLGGKIEASVADDVAQRSAEIRMARGFAWLTSVIAVAIGSVGMLNTMLMAVFERTREIAMLRAIGWRRRRVIAMVLGESTLLCSAGAVLGIAAAVLMVRLLSGMPAAGRLVTGEVSVTVMMQGFVLALLLGILGGLYPAWSAARMAPVEGLRHE